MVKIYLNLVMNIEKIREETKGCHDKIFLNSAGASLMPQPVIESMFHYLKQEEEWGGYKIAQNNDALIQSFYSSAAELINCSPKNIAFVSSATDAYAKALSSIPFQKGDTIITTKDDYVSNHIAFISLVVRFQINIVRVDNLSNNELDIDQFETYIQQYQPKLVAVTHIPTSSGLIQSVQAIGKLCKQYDVLYLVDACQSVGQIPVDVKDLQCDFLSATGRKFLRGPRGTGFLYVSDKVLEKGMYPLFLDSAGTEWIAADQFRLSDSAKRFEFWENSIASMIGLNEAIQYANSIGMDAIQEYNLGLSNQLRNGLNQLPRVTVMDKGVNLCNIITFTVEGMALTELESILNENRICYSITHKKSAIIDFTEKGIDWACRFSPHYFNTSKELNQTLEILEKALSN